MLGGVTGKLPRALGTVEEVVNIEQLFEHFALGGRGDHDGEVLVLWGHGVFLRRWGKAR